MGVTSCLRAKGSLLGPGFRSEFSVVTVVADANKVAGYAVGTLADYIAMLALAQTKSFAGCRELVSISNLMAPDCDPARKVTALTDTDIAYLRGLYQMDPTTYAGLQEAGLAAWMKKDLAAEVTDFDGTAYTCERYVTGVAQRTAPDPTHQLARLWVEGYLAGFYKAEDRLNVSDDAGEHQALDAAILQACQAHPDVSIMLAAMHVLAAEPHSVPARSAANFAPGTYTCGLLVDARQKTDGDRAMASAADIADLWGFAFIQGFKHGSLKDIRDRKTLIVMPIDRKAGLMAALLKNCAANREVSLLEMMAAVAEKVVIR